MMEIYELDGSQIRLREIDEEDSEQVGCWLCRLFPKDQRDLVLGYYSLLLHREHDPISAATRTVETMGPACIQTAAEAINALRDELKEEIKMWLQVISKKYDWF
jgi:hypothetical protein